MERVFLLLLLSFSALAQSTIVWNGQSDIRDIGGKALVLEDKNHQYTIQEVSSAAFKSKFTPSQQQVLSYANTSFYWLKFKIQNNSAAPVLLELAQPIIAEVDFYHRDSLTGKWEVLHAGYNVPFSKKPYRHQFQLFPLAKGNQEYYLRLQSKGMSIPVRIWEESAYEDKSSNQKITFGIFSGLMFFVILTNLLFFFTLRKLPHLHYAILVSLYYLTALTTEGFIVYVFPTFDLFYGPFIFSIINMPIGVTFAMSFLGTHKTTPQLNKIGLGLTLYYVSFIFWHRFLSPMNLVYVTYFNGLLVVLIMASFGIQVGRKGNKMGYYFFVSYMLFFILAAIDSKSRFTGSPPYIFDLSYNSLGFLVEAIALSYLLTLRFDWERKALEKERLVAQSLLLEQTQKNEKMIKEQNILLEQKVIERTAKLDSSLKELRATQAQLIQKEKLASLGELTAGIAHEIQNPLNFVNNFSELSVELIEELKAARQQGTEARDEAMEEEILSDLIQNQQKINYHGKRASSIVKGMLEHSRMGTGERQSTDINALCDEFLRLSYHGMRAKDKNGSAPRFNADYKLMADPSLPHINIVPQDIGRVLLNLINNAFYAVHQKAKSTEKYMPSVVVTTKQADNKVIISVKDNGEGIAEHIKSKIFQPFFTTKPTGEGTGLGLSLSYDIITKGHGGSLMVTSTEGEGTEFVIHLPI